MRHGVLNGLKSDIAPCTVSCHKQSFRLRGHCGALGQLGSRAYLGPATVSSPWTLSSLTRIRWNWTTPLF